MICELFPIREHCSTLMISSPQVAGRRQMILLVSLVENILHCRGPENTSKKTEKANGNDLRKEEYDKVRRLLCGPGGGAGGGPRIDRFVRSFIELGNPQAGMYCTNWLNCWIAMILTRRIIALEASQRKAQSRRRSIEQDLEGLPTNLQLPPKQLLFEPPISTSSSSEIAAPITRGAREQDSPPREFLGDVTTSPVIRGVYDGTAESTWSGSSTQRRTSSGGKEPAFKEVFQD